MFTTASKHVLISSSTVLVVSTMLLAILTDCQPFGSKANWYYIFKNLDMDPMSVSVDSASGAVFVSGRNNDHNTAYGAVFSKDGKYYSVFEKSIPSGYDVVSTYLDNNLPRLYVVHEKSYNPADPNPPNRFYVESCNLLGTQLISTQSNATASFLDRFSYMAVHKNEELTISSKSSSGNSFPDGYFRRYGADGSFKWRLSANGQLFSQFSATSTTDGFAASATKQLLKLLKIQNTNVSMENTYGDVDYNGIAVHPVSGIVSDDQRGFLYAYGVSSAPKFGTIQNIQVPKDGVYYHLSQFNMKGELVKSTTFNAENHDSSGFQADDVIASAVIDPETGDVILAGSTSGNLPGFQKSSFGSTQDIFLYRFSSALKIIGSAQYGTLNENVEDRVAAIAINRSKKVLYIVGTTVSAFGFNATSRSLKTRAFVAEIALFSSDTPSSDSFDTFANGKQMNMLELLRDIEKVSKPPGPSPPPPPPPPPPQDDLTKLIYSMFNEDVAKFMVQYFLYIMLVIGLILVLATGCTIKICFSKCCRSKKKENTEEDPVTNRSRKIPMVAVKDFDSAVGKIDYNSFMKTSQPSEGGVEFSDDMMVNDDFGNLDMNGIPVSATITSKQQLRPQASIDDLDEMGKNLSSY